MEEEESWRRRRRRVGGQIEKESERKWRRNGVGVPRGEAMDEEEE